LVLVGLDEHANDVRPLAPQVTCDDTDEDNVYVRTGDSPRWEQAGTALAIDVVQALTAIGHLNGASFAEREPRVRSCCSIRIATPPPCSST
jgi:hypothetical protein